MAIGRSTASAAGLELILERTWLQVFSTTSRTSTKGLFKGLCLETSMAGGLEKTGDPTGRLL